MECAKAEWNALIKILSNNSRLHMSVECRFGMLRPLVYDYGIAWHIDCIAISKSHSYCVHFVLCYFAFIYLHCANVKAF